MAHKTKLRALRKVTMTTSSLVHKPMMFRYSSRIVQVQQTKPMQVMILGNILSRSGWITTQSFLDQGTPLTNTLKWPCMGSKARRSKWGLLISRCKNVLLIKVTVLTCRHKTNLITKVSSGNKTICKLVVQLARAMDWEILK